MGWDEKCHVSLEKMLVSWCFTRKNVGLLWKYHGFTGKNGGLTCQNGAWTFLNSEILKSKLPHELLGDFTHQKWLLFWYANFWVTIWRMSGKVWIKQDQSHHHLPISDGGEVINNQKARISIITHQSSLEEPTPPCLKSAAKPREAGSIHSPESIITLRQKVPLVFSKTLSCY